VSDPDGKDSYPIVTFTWMCFYKQYDSKDKLEAIKGLAIYGLTDGQKDSDALGYVPLPDSISTKAQAAIKSL
jgi:phosphate transport system substrate-binding protein